MEIYKTTPRSISSLIDWIARDNIWLPDLQRPYVWDRARVRDLFDSLYNWYPTWLLIFLENNTEKNIKWIWNKETWWQIPRYVVIDWQQRLTSLYASLTWFEVTKSDGKKEKIIISFNPIKEIFSVADSSTEKWNEWIYDIKEIVQWDDSWNLTNNYINEYKLRSGNDYNPEIEKKIWQNIQRLTNIKSIKFTCIEIFDTTPIEIVSEIFLRINSKWKTLNNSDFILTLMSVYRDDWRKAVEEFSLYTHKKNDIVVLDPDEIVRVLVGVWFKRSKLEDTYNFLKAGQTNNQSEFNKLDDIIKIVIDKNNWSNFLILLKDLWFIHSKLITQKSVVIASYIFYLIWLKEYWMSLQSSNYIIKKFFVSMFISQKYSSNAFESVLRNDFINIEKITTADEFIVFLEKEISISLTPDMRNIVFPKKLDTHSSSSPLRIIYLVSQIHFQRPILFRNVPLSKFYIDLKDNERLKENIDIDCHHIFPKQYLLDTFWSNWITQYEINHIANKAYTYKSDNKTISDKKPEVYRTLFEKQNNLLNENLSNNAIPYDFDKLDYKDFLEARKKLMLEKIKEYVDYISNPNSEVIRKPITMLDIISQWESRIVEFKSSYRWDIYQTKRNDDLKYQIVKTIAAFLNTDWWKLFVWVNDSKEVIWLENDIGLFPDKSIDSLLLDIDNLLKKHFSDQYALISVECSSMQWKDILIISVKSSKNPVYFEINGKSEFYIRKAASSESLTINEAVNYIRDWFN